MAFVPSSGSQIPNDGAAVTPSDTTLLNDACIGLYVGVAGDVTVDWVGGETDSLYKAVPAGSTLVGRFLRVKSTGTTATNIQQLFVT